MTLRITGSDVTPSIQETTLPMRPFYVSNFLNHTKEQVTGHFVVEASSKQHLNREKFRGPDYYRYLHERRTYFIRNCLSTALLIPIEA